MYYYCWVAAQARWLVGWMRKVAWSIPGLNRGCTDLDDQIQIDAPSLWWSICAIWVSVGYKWCFGRTSVYWSASSMQNLAVPQDVYSFNIYRWDDLSTDSSVVLDGMQARITVSSALEHLTTVPSITYFSSIALLLADAQQHRQGRLWVCASVGEAHTPKNKVNRLIRFLDGCLSLLRVQNISMYLQRKEQVPFSTALENAQLLL